MLAGFPVGAVVKSPLPIQEAQEIWVQFPCGEDPLEKKLATHFSIFAWEIPWTKQLGRGTVNGVSKELDKT